MINVASSYLFVELAPNCKACAEVASDFAQDQLRVIILLVFILFHFALRGVRSKTFPEASKVLDISLFWGGIILTTSLVYRAWTNELLFKLVGLDGFVTMVVGAIMTFIASFNTDENLADAAFISELLKSALKAVRSNGANPSANKQGKP